MSFCFLLLYLLKKIPLTGDTESIKRWRHNMFTIKIYASPENFKTLLEGMKVTFRRVGVQQHHLFLTVSFYFRHFILHLKVTLRGLFVWLVLTLFSAALVLTPYKPQTGLWMISLCCLYVHQVYANAPRF